MMPVPNAGPPPFRAEHIGSLLRPETVKTAFGERQAGRIDEAEYRAIVDAEIARVVRLQEEIGLKVITDGEFTRSSWFGFVFDSLEGFELDTAVFRFRDADGRDYEWPTCVAATPIRQTGPIVTDEFERLAGLTERTPKTTLPSLSAFHFFRFDAAVDPKAYPDVEGFFDDLVAIYRAEIEALDRRGCRYLQLDEVPLAMLCDETIRDQVRSLNEDPDTLIGRYIDLANRVLAGRPAGMTVGMHLCRGNFRGRWMAAGGYEPIAERLFNEIAVDAFYLEYDTERAGGFEPLRFVPPDRSVVLGLVSTKTPALERKATLTSRIDKAAHHVPLGRLCLSPQCGFASVAGGNPLTEADERAKLRLVVETAAEVWGDAA